MQIDLKRRQLLIGATAVGLSALSAYAFSQPEANVIKITARRFEYSPNQIHLKKDVPVVLEFTSLDIVMGFSLPDFNVRTDIIPGMLTRVSFTPDKIGEFLFHCDIFCGAGHEDMTGVVIVDA